MAITFTRKGYIRLFRDGVQISQHTSAEEAYESATAHAEANGPGKYRVTYPDRELSVWYHSIRSGAPTSGGGSGVFFQPDLGLYSAPSDIWDVNTNGAPGILQNSVLRPGGQSKALRIAYDTEDDGIELYIPGGFPATQSLFTSWYMMYGPEWEGYWPVGLKTNRYFTNPEATVVIGDPGTDGDVYCSAKFLWQRYPADGGDSTAAYVWGLNHACNNMEVPTGYTAGQVFNNGLAYPRAGVWYRYEMWMVLNSAVNANDGILECRIDGVTVFSNHAWPWASTGSSNPGGQNRQVVNGLAGWQQMWFGGNISANGGFGAGGTLYRYEDSHYLSTTADWA